MWLLIIVGSIAIFYKSIFAHISLICKLIKTPKTKRTETKRTVKPFFKVSPSITIKFEGDTYTPVVHVTSSEANEAAKMMSEYLTPNRKLYSYLNSCIDKFNASKFRKLENYAKIKIANGKIQLRNYDIGYVIKNCTILDNVDVGGLFDPNNLMIKVDPDHVTEEVVAHELAHAIDFTIRGFSCHDQFWQTIMDSMVSSQNYLDSHLDRENEPDLDCSEWEYVNDGYRMCFINYITGQRVYHGDAIFHTLKKSMIGN